MPLWPRASDSAETFPGKDRQRYWRHPKRVGPTRHGFQLCQVSTLCPKGQSEFVHDSVQMLFSQHARGTLGVQLQQHAVCSQAEDAW